MGAGARHDSLIRATLLVGVALFLSACASVPFDYPREPSAAVPPSAESAVGAATLNWKDFHGDKAGFLGLGEGVDALGARLRLL